MASAVAQARTADAPFPEATAYLDAIAGEIAFRSGDMKEADRLASAALAHLPREEALLRYRTQAWHAGVLSVLGRAADAQAAYQEVLQRWPTAFRLLDLELPVTLSTDGSALAEETSGRLAGSKRFAVESSAPFRLRVDSHGGTAEICLLDDHGGQLSCASGEGTVKALEAFHAAAFSPKVSLAESDLTEPRRQPRASGGRRGAQGGAGAMRSIALVLMLMLMLGAVSGGAEEPEDCAARHGRWTHREGSEGCLVKGRPDGTWITRRAGGQLAEVATWLMGKREGPSVRYHDNCQVSERGRYAGGLREGPWLFFSPAGRTLREGGYLKGRPEGPWVFYDSESGQRQLEGPFVAGVGQGTFTEYFVTGVRWREFEMDRGERVGPGPKACRAKGGRWDIDYRVRAEGCSVDDVRTGSWTGYDGAGGFVGAASTGRVRSAAPTKTFTLAAS